MMDTIDPELLIVLKAGPKLGYLLRKFLATKDTIDPELLIVLKADDWPKIGVFVEETPGHHVVCY